VDLPTANPLRRGLTSVATRKPRNHAVRIFALNPLTFARLSRNKLVVLIIRVLL